MKKINSNKKKITKEADDVISILDEISKGKDGKDKIEKTVSKTVKQPARHVASQGDAGEKNSVTVKENPDQKEKTTKKAKKKSNLDRTKLYSAKEAIELLKKEAKTKFVSSLELHLNLLEKGFKQNVPLPFGTGKKVNVAVVSDELLASIEKGVIDFDILITNPSFMPKLAKFAKVLGPKGLMPNPKNGTVTTNVEKAVLDFSKGQVQIKTESEAPLIHQLIGKVDMKTEELEANIKAIIDAVKKTKIKSAFLAATMTPSLKLDFLNV
jgi:large subunit ribosomal protein L1